MPGNTSDGSFANLSCGLERFWLKSVLVGSGLLGKFLAERFLKERKDLRKALFFLFLAPRISIIIQRAISTKGISIIYIYFILPKNRLFGDFLNLFCCGAWIRTVSVALAPFESQTCHASTFRIKRNQLQYSFSRHFFQSPNLKRFLSRFAIRLRIPNRSTSKLRHNFRCTLVSANNLPQ